MTASSAPRRSVLLPTLCFVLTGAAIWLLWMGLGRPVPLPAAADGAPQTYQCVSYAPFRGDQSPTQPATYVAAAQIEEDLAALKAVTSCIRTYSIENGLEQVPAIARRHGLKVLQGIWLSSDRPKNRKMIEATVALIKDYTDVVQALIVGNEVLLRGEMGATELGETLRAVKAQVSVPVTYADVWEFWLRNRDLAGAVDFITIHVLPYWEDLPIPAEQGAAHLAAIRRQVVQAFPGRDIFVGEFGWPSAGRMREGALPSPTAQARVVAEGVALAARDKFRLNVIEAYDQPWKRQLEGTVGGHWGLYDAGSRARKFTLGSAVSDHPWWRTQAAGGIGLAALIFAAAAWGVRRRGAPDGAALWAGVSLIAVTAGTLAGWAIANAPLESLGFGGWLRSLALVALALLVPVAAAAGLGAKQPSAVFAGVLARRRERTAGRLSWLLGALMIATTLLAVQAALGLVFDPRYKDIPFAPLTAAIVPFLVLDLARRGPWLGRQAAETVLAVLLAGSAVYIALNETFANWQALWFCGALLALALILVRARAARG